MGSRIDLVMRMVYLRVPSVDTVQHPDETPAHSWHKSYYSLRAQTEYDPFFEETQGGFSAVSCRTGGACVQPHHSLWGY